MWAKEQSDCLKIIMTEEFSMWLLTHPTQIVTNLGFLKVTKNTSCVTKILQAYNFSMLQNRVDQLFFPP